MQAFAVFGVVGEALEHFAQAPRMLSRLDHGAVDLRERVGKRGEAVRQGLALEHARPHRGEQRARSGRFRLLDKHVEALFDSEPGADQRGELARDERESLA